VDALQNPSLIYENMARMKRLADSIKYSGPVAIAGDCTKVRARLTYSNDFGSHILGSTLPLDKCEVDPSDDIDEIIDKIAHQGVLATQVRAILVKVHFNSACTTWGNLTTLIDTRFPSLTFLLWLLH